MRRELGEHRVPEGVIDDAVLVLSELLSNACRHARPLAPDELDRIPAEDTAHGESEPSDGRVVVTWELHSDGLLTVEVTDGGGHTRPMRSSPSLTARGGRGLGIVGELAVDWGVRSTPGEQTVWAVLRVRARHARRDADQAAAG